MGHGIDEGCARWDGVSSVIEDADCELYPEECVNVIMEYCWAALWGWVTL